MTYNITKENKNSLGYLAEFLKTKLTKFHLSEKASKDRFLGPEKLQNHTNENEFSWDDVTDKFSTPAPLINALAGISAFHFYISHNTPCLPPPPQKKKKKIA